MIRRLALAGLAAGLTGCATLPPPPPASTADCAILMFAAGFIAEHQPPLWLSPKTADVAAMAQGRLRLAVELPETYAPDADPAAVAALADARRKVRAERLACPLDKSPFVAWRPGRGQLVLSTPAVTPAGDFAVMDAAVLLPGQRVDYYRFMLSGPPKEGWDLHRITFASAPLKIGR